MTSDSLLAATSCGFSHFVFDTVRWHSWAPGQRPHGRGTNASSVARSQQARGWRGAKCSRMSPGEVFANVPEENDEVHRGASPTDARDRAHPDHRSLPHARARSGPQDSGVHGNGHRQHPRRSLPLARRLSFAPAAPTTSSIGTLWSQSREQGCQSEDTRCPSARGCDLSRSSMYQTFRALIHSDLPFSSSNCPNSSRARPRATATS